MISDKNIERMILVGKLRDEGKTYREIGIIINRSHTLVALILYKLNKIKHKGQWEKDRNPARYKRTMEAIKAYQTRFK
jgi:hypothetical protein